MNPHSLRTIQGKLRERRKRYLNHLLHTSQSVAPSSTKRKKKFGKNKGKEINGKD